jgi:hypothetical protein
MGGTLAAKLGIWNLGITGLLKAATLATASMTVLPIAIGVGALSYLYSESEKKQIKLKCRLIV